jgi:hypothetical protein
LIIIPLEELADAAHFRPAGQIRHYEASKIS